MNIFIYKQIKPLPLGSECKGDDSVKELIADSGLLDSPLKINPSNLEVFHESTFFRKW